MLAPPSVEIDYPQALGLRELPGVIQQQHSGTPALAAETGRARTDTSSGSSAVRVEARRVYNEPSQPSREVQIEVLLRGRINLRLTEAVA